MDLLKSSLGWNKETEVKIVHPTQVLGAQIANILVKDLQINVEKTEEEYKLPEQSMVKNDECEETIKYDISREGIGMQEKKQINVSKTKLKNLLMELLDTEINYVHDLEEVVDNLNHPL